MIKELKGLPLRISVAKLIFSDARFILYGLLGGSIITFLFILLTDYPLLYGNYGALYYYLTLLTQFIIVILFSLNISAFSWRFVQSYRMRKSATATTSIGSILVLLVTGCSSCGLSIASYLGLASFFSSFPFAGLEIKFLGVILLLYSNYILYTPVVCKINPK